MLILYLKSKIRDGEDMDPESLGMRRRCSYSQRPSAWVEAGRQREGAAVKSHMELAIVNRKCPSGRKQASNWSGHRHQGPRHGDFYLRQHSSHWKGVGRSKSVPDKLGQLVIERQIRWELTWWNCGISHGINHNSKQEDTRSQQDYDRAGFAS